MEGGNAGHGSGSRSMRVLIADDHALFRAGLRELLTEIGEEVCVLEAGSYLRVRELLEEGVVPELAILDLDMPGFDQMRGLHGLLEDYPALPVLVLSGSLDTAHMQEVLAAGALGYIPKTSAPPVLLGAIRLVLAGGVYVPPDLVGLGKKAERVESPIELTPRQHEVLECIVAGHSNKVIARELGISEKTVKAHLGVIFRALGVENRTQAAMVASSTPIFIRDE